MMGISGALSTRPTAEPATSMARLAIRTLRNTELTVTCLPHSGGRAGRDPRLDLTFLSSGARWTFANPAGLAMLRADGSPDPPQRARYAPLPADRGAHGRGGRP